MTNHKTLIAGLAILAVGAVAGWGASHAVDPKPSAIASTDTSISFNPQEPAAGNITPMPPYTPAPARRAVVTRGITLPAGTAVHVVVDQGLSSKTAQVGDGWTGTVTEAIDHNGRVLIPAGSSVHGTVVVSEPAVRGDRAKLQLAMTSVVANGRTYAVRGRSETIVAGSPRTRNIGAIAGGTAAGALIGRVVGGSTKSTVIGAAIGGGAATAVIATSKGYQANIDAGKNLAFTTTTSATFRA